MTGLLRAELKKIRSTRLWWGLLIGALVLSAIQSVAMAAIAGVDMGSGPGTGELSGLEDAATVRAVYPMAMFTGTYIFALVLGIIGMAGEYRHQTITSTFLVSPRRSRVVVAKLLAHFLAGLAYALVGLVVVLVAGGITMSVRGYGLGLDADRLWPTMGLAMLAVAIWAVIGVGVGTLLRNQIVAIVAAVLFVWLVEPLLSLVLTLVEWDHVSKWLPSNASSALMAPGGALGELLVWWAGGLVLLAYGLAIAGLGVLLSMRRDVS